MSELMQSLISCFAPFQIDPDASPDISVSGSGESWILHQKICIANCVTVTIQQYHNPDTVVDQNTSSMEKCDVYGNQFNPILIQED